MGLRSSRGEIFHPYANRTRLRESRPRWTPKAARRRKSNYPIIRRPSSAPSPGCSADEGGYVDNPADPGGETKFGISKREYPDLEIATLTRADAVAIYYRDWWQRYRYSELPGPIASEGVRPGGEYRPRITRCDACSARCARAAAGSTEDGALGRATNTGGGGPINSRLLAALRAEAAGYYRALAALERGRRAGGDREFLDGWLNRAYE